MDGSQGGKTPFFLRGNYAPVQDEVTLDALEVEGAIPPELTGVYLRNGPNPSEGSSQHWFFGDGMLHGVALQGGQALWYRNRFVQTKQLAGQPMMRPDFSVDYTVAAANTSVARHAGKLFALVESSFPTEVTSGLDTIGPYDFGGALKSNFTAHPKICPETGEMHAFGYGYMPPWLTYHRIGADGALIESVPIDMGGPTMIHDFALTRHHVIFLDLPIVFDMNRALRGKMPFVWSDAYPARIGVMPRGGSNRDVRWASVAACYVFHVANAFEAEGRIVLDVARYAELWRAESEKFQSAAELARWTIDLSAMTVREETLDPRAMEFPRIDDRRTGLPYRYAYAASGDGAAAEGGADFAGLIRHDLQTGQSIRRDFGAGALVSEFSFAPAGPGEDEGWLMGFVHDAARAASDFWILEAESLKPAACVRLPRRVPQGFHGGWFDGPPPR